MSVAELVSEVFIYFVESSSLGGFTNILIIIKTSWLGNVRGGKRIHLPRTVSTCGYLRWRTVYLLSGEERSLTSIVSRRFGTSLSEEVNYILHKTSPIIRIHFAIY